MPLRSTWLAAMSMTLMMKAMAKAQIRLLRTHVCFTCCVGLEPVRDERREPVHCWGDDSSCVSITPTILQNLHIAIKNLSNMDKRFLRSREVGFQTYHQIFPDCTSTTKGMSEEISLSHLRAVSPHRDWNVDQSLERKTNAFAFFFFFCLRGFFF